MTQFARVVTESDPDHPKGAAIVGVFAHPGDAAKVASEHSDRYAREAGYDDTQDYSEVERKKPPVHAHETIPVHGDVGSDGRVTIVHSPSTADYGPSAIHAVHADKDAALAHATALSQSNWAFHGDEFEPSLGPDDFGTKWASMARRHKEMNPKGQSLDKMWDQIPMHENAVSNSSEGDQYQQAVLKAAGKNKGDRVEYPGLAAANRFFHENAEPHLALHISRAKLNTKL